MQLVNGTQIPESTEEFAELPIRVGEGGLRSPTEDRLRFLSQLGVNDLMLNMYTAEIPSGDAPLTGEREWSYRELVGIRDQLADTGVRLNVIEGVPVPMQEEIIFGGDRREEQLEHFKNTVRNMGRANIPVLSLLWLPIGVWRTSRDDRGRGGAVVAGFDLDEIDDRTLFDREYSKEELWENFEYFLQEVVPVAEEAGVTISLHPSDPPVDAMLGGFSPLLTDFEDFERALDVVESDNLGLTFCLGNWSARYGDEERLCEFIRHFGERDDIVYVHFQSVEGTVPSFHETFIDQGNYDEFAIMETLYEVGFDGMIISGHVPHLAMDGPWRRPEFSHGGWDEAVPSENVMETLGGTLARAYWIGYLRAMMRSIERDR